MAQSRLVFKITAPGSEETIMRQTHMPDGLDHAMRVVDIQGQHFTARGLTAKWTFTDADGIEHTGVQRPEPIRFGNHDETTLRAVAAFLRTHGRAPDGFDAETLADVIEASIRPASPWNLYTLTYTEGTTHFGARDDAHAIEKARMHVDTYRRENPALYRGHLDRIKEWIGP